MNCWHCDRPAHAVCRFCGRAVCREHVQKMPYILEVFGSETQEYKGLVVPDVVHCGVCKPKDDPVILEPLKKT
jgi:hypothetical protein